MNRQFQKRKENFVCEHCGASVIGDGYTNHCPKCLWSKHVDVNPGDRAASCSGMMRPVSINKKGEQYRITHVCEACGYEKVNDTSATDDFSALLGIATQE